MRLLLKDLNTEQILALTNGCGPKGLEGIVPEFVYEMACRQHDLDYQVGGDEKARLLADKNFLKGMLEAACSAVWFKRAFYIFLSWRYYRAVRKYGKRRFVYRSSEELANLTVETLLSEVA